jgi:beta-glucosidase
MTENKQMNPDNNSQFMWGVATSAYQFEGGIENDMSEWEQLGKFRTEHINPKYDVASDHWTRWQEDIELLQQLKVNTYRFSIEWARVEPEPGVFDQSALDQYRHMILKMRKYGIEPILTLLHFTHPVWFHKQVPWHKPESVDAFVNFSTKVIESLGDLVNWYITINEPVVWALAAYGDAKFPPGKKDLNLMMKSLTHMLEAHVQIYDRLKTQNPDAMVGIAKNFIIFEPKRKWHILDLGVYNLIHSFYNFMLVRAFKRNTLAFNFPFLINFKKPVQLDNKIDFWGINYYYRMRVNFKLNAQLPFELSFRTDGKEGNSALGWEIYSRGLLKILRWLQETKKPVMITENGIATENDEQRIEFMRNSIGILQQAIKQKYPILGYLHWSFMDNYEWLVGKDARFGLVHVDYSNQCRRTPKQSAQYFTRLITSQL